MVYNGKYHIYDAFIIYGDTSCQIKAIGRPKRRTF